MTLQRVLLLPGWQNSDAQHWQTCWEHTHGYLRVEQDDWQWPRRGDWMSRLNEVLLSHDAPAVLVAHSLGCHLVAAWAAHSRHAARVSSALLVVPPDTERTDTPPQLHNWRPIARQSLPFPSIAVLSNDDPYCTVSRASEMAVGWGSTVVIAGALGHINGDSGLGDWPEGLALLQSLITAP